MLQREPGDGGPLAYKAQRWPGAHAELLFVALEAGRFERPPRGALTAAARARSPKRHAASLAWNVFLSAVFLSL
jgi:hypothetical protein